jgi:hypothetical protein
MLHRERRSDRLPSTCPNPPLPLPLPVPLNPKADKGALKLDLLFSGSLEPLELALKETGYKQTRTDLDALRKALRTEVRGMQPERQR